MPSHGVPIQEEQARDGDEEGSPEREEQHCQQGNDGAKDNADEGKMPTRRPFSVSRRWLGSGRRAISRVAAIQ